MAVGVYPGSFNPPTVAHLAIAEAAVRTHRLDRIDLVVSREALDKEDVDRPHLEDRLSVLREVAASRPWLAVAVTEHQLLVDIAAGYDLLVVGADKYQQLLDVRYYEHEQARDDALARLPPLAIAPRPPHEAPPDRLLEIDPRHHDVSSTRVRAGDRALMVPEASAFDAATGVWTDARRYDAWRRRANSAGRADPQGPAPYDGARMPFDNPAVDDPVLDDPPIDNPAIDDPAADGTAPPVASNRSNPGPGRFFELLALWGLTVAQPVLDSFSGSPETFVYRRASTTDIVVFALAVTFALPVLLWIVEWGVAAWNTRVASWLHMAFLAALFGVAGWQLVERHTTWRVSAHVAVGVLLAVTGTVVVSRYRPPRTVLRFLALSPVVVALLWIGTGPVHEVAFAEGPGTAQGAPVDNPAPIVMVVLDELPIASLLDEDGEIDETLWPGFARLAGDGTWYRNTSSVSPTTPEAVPAILTGNYPGELDVPPTAASHPENMFRALEGTYELNVWELVAQLCPPVQCPALGGAVDQGLPALLDDAADLWLDYVDEPPATEEEAFAIRQSDPESPRKFEQFIASLEDTSEPRLDFIHIALPHQPWRHLPSGARHDAPFLAEGLGEPNYSWQSPTFAMAGRQRHLLQLQRADALLAQMLQRLDDLDRYDESLIVVTADHGVAFDADEPIRGLSEGNAEQIMWVPLFVKEPHQPAGAVDDRPLETIDIFPTITDIIDLDVPWEVDGQPAAEPRTEADETRRFYPWRLNEVTPSDGDDYAEIDGAAVFDALFDVGVPGSEPRDDLQLYRFGEWGPLVGSETSALEIGEASELVAELYDADGRAVRPDHFELDAGEEILPVYVRGRRVDDGDDGDGDDTADGAQVVVAVNGFVAGWGDWFTKQDAEQFFVLAPQQLFAPSSNSIALYELGGTAADPVLHPLEIDWP